MATVSNCIPHGYWAPVDFTWPMGLPEVQEWHVLADLLGQVKFSDRKDSWVWDGSSCFSVAQVKEKMKVQSSMIGGFKLKWVSWVPKKCQVFAWRAEMDRIPTVEALAKRNVFVPNDRCKLCNDDYETSTHIFCGCGFSFGVWSHISKWCGFNTPVASQVRDLLHLYKHARGGKWGKKVVHGIVMIMLWMLWKARNNKTFNKIDPKILCVIGSIKSTSYLWLKSRSHFKDLCWDDWCNNPLYMV